MKKIFVYGTLKRGFRLHRYLHIADKKSRFMGNHTVLGRLELADEYAPYSVLLPGVDNIKGELWEVSDEEFSGPLAILEIGYMPTLVTLSSDPNIEAYVYMKDRKPDDKLYIGNEYLLTHQKKGHTDPLPCKHCSKALDIEK